MKFIFYFLIIVNAAFLMLNWESFNGAPKTGEGNQVRAGESLTLIGEKQIPASARQQELPVSRPNDLTRFIDGALAFLSTLWTSFWDLVRDKPQELPTPAVIPESVTYCFVIGDYLSPQNALADKRKLLAEDIETTLSSEEKQQKSSGSYRVETHVRSNLDIAKKFSDVLSGEGIPNTIKENPPIGYLLVSRSYNSRDKAQAIDKKIRRIGLSSYIKGVPGSGPSSASGATTTTYKLRITGKSATKWNEIGRILATQLYSGVKARRLSQCP